MPREQCEPQLQDPMDRKVARNIVRQVLRQYDPDAEDAELRLEYADTLLNRVEEAEAAEQETT